MTRVGPRGAAAPALDVACLGRAAVDLYANEIGIPLAQVRTFSMYVGGCPGNVAIGTARLGLRSAMITRVSADPLGDFVVRTLEREGVSTSGIRRDPERLTGLVILGIEPPDRFPLIFYRENCADIHLTPGDLDRALVEGARVLFVSGTCLSREPSASATWQAVRWSRAAGRRVVLDVDLRPTLWPGGVGAFARATRPLLAEVDLAIGTEEEFAAATGETDPERSLSAARVLTDAVLAQKRGARGSTIDAPGERLSVPAHHVRVLNVLGAGDGYASGLIDAWLAGWPWDMAASWANAVGAIVVTRHGCAPAMPTRREVERFLARRGVSEGGRWRARRSTRNAPRPGHRP